MRLYGFGSGLFGASAALSEFGRLVFYGAIAEGFAVIAEGFYLRAFEVQRPFVWSLVANAASVVVGSVGVWILWGL